MHDDATPEPTPDDAAALPAEFAATDPEFAALITRFAGVEVQAHSQLTDHDRFLVQLGATIAVGGHTVFRLVLDQALHGGVSPVVVKEIVYQATAYVGVAVLGGAAPSDRAGLLATLYLISYAGAAAPGLVAGRLAVVMPPDQIAVGYGALVLIAATIAVVLFRTPKATRASATPVPTEHDQQKETSCTSNRAPRP